MLSRFGFGHEAVSASGSDAELAAFLEKEAEEEDPEKTKKAQKQKKRPDEDRPKLFMELKWSEQRKMGQKAQVLRQVEGDSINQRIRLYRRTIFFHIHSKLEHNGYVTQRLRLNNQNPNGKDGAEAAVRTLIHEETTIDDPDLEMRWTPLHYAVMGGHETIVERLVDKAPVRRITINRKDVRSLLPTPSCQGFVVVGFSSFARLLFVCSNQKCGMTPLMLACGEDHADVAKLLLRKKAFIDETDKEGWSALHYAAANDSALAAEVLVHYDVNLQARTEATNETALEMAERLRSHLVAILLYEMTYRKPH
ncbi:hypothetical protein PHYPSEUDO_013248 [Phytophthora pseudosyringae]|uniref:Uncharacterized protein n=1 Tax=Phytophthora pseudosyringae TaxID=221518 RepID=A0A8T1W436_9STRA|nr:hypothetical protein PHYPSEUDO_013248 [Phytophthora pseudosyringae]